MCPLFPKRKDYPISQGKWYYNIFFRLLQPNNAAFREIYGDIRFMQSGRRGGIPP